LHKGGAAAALYKSALGSLWAKAKALSQKTQLENLAFYVGGAHNKETEKLGAFSLYQWKICSRERGRGLKLIIAPLIL